MPFTYSGSATTRDERITILRAVQELTQDEALVLVVKNAMDASGDIPVAVTVTGTIASYATSAQVSVTVTPKILTARIDESCRAIEVMQMFYGDFALPVESVRVAESLTVVRA